MKKIYFTFVAAALFVLTAGANAFDFNQLGALKAADLTATAGTVITVPQALPPVACIAPSRAVQPGTSILPAISDQGRVQGILALIKKIYDGVPLPFPPHDGSTFTNTEGVLPKQAAPDFYKEYTFIPPHNSPSDITIGGQAYHVSPPIGKRGAERIIIGGGSQVFYTVDHYKTFVQLTIVQ